MSPQKGIYAGKRDDIEKVSENATVLL